MFFLLVLLPLAVARVLQEGEECNAGNGISGICKKKAQCISGRTSRFESEVPKFEACEGAFAGRQQLFCCPATVKRIEKACSRYRRYAKTQYSGLISGGTVAKLGQFPHMAALWYEAGKPSPWQCGGSVISTRFVLTAAHCLENNLPTKVRVGDHDLMTTENDEYAAEYQVAQIIVHPRYNPSKSMYNDIGLVKTDLNMKIGYYVFPACLRTSSGRSSTFRYSISGWGAVKMNIKSRMEVTQPLRFARIEAKANKECSDYYNGSLLMEKYPKGIETDSLVCAVTPEGNFSNTCQGDSGGPLQYLDNGVYLVTGITTRGTTCGGAEPEIFTRVAKFASWIDVFICGDNNSYCRLN